MYTLAEVKRNIRKNVEGKIKAVHTLDKHRYQLPGGLLVDSVTTRNILDKPHLLPWAVGLAIDFFEEDQRWKQLKGPTREALLVTAKFLANSTRDDAGLVGTKAHDILDTWCKKWITTGKKPGDIRRYAIARKIEDHRVWGAIRSGEASFKKYNVVPVASELLVGWGKEGAGTLDLLVLNEKGELELWDWKTSNGVDDFYAMQVAAYRWFFQKMTGLKIAKVRIFRLAKESDRFHCYNVPRPNEAYASFRCLSKVYDWRQNLDKKLVEDKKRIIV